MGNKDILEKLCAKYEERIGVFDTTDELMGKYNPWKTEKSDELIENFFNGIKNKDKDFSWLKIDDKLYELKNHKDKNGETIKPQVSIDYGLPTHIHGDINNSTLFICLVNPNIDYVGRRKEDIGKFYENASKKNSEDISLNLIDEDGNITIDYSNIIKYIINLKSDSGVFYNELQKFQKSGEISYYLKNYFSIILSSYFNENFKVKDILNLDKSELVNIMNMSKKITNLEAFPFRSKNPGFSDNKSLRGSNFSDLIVDLKSDVSMLSSRFIVWKIVDYLKHKEDKIKPIFIFRRFNQAWYPSIKNVLTEDLKIPSAESERIINVFHNEFFLTMRKKDHKTNSGFDRGLYMDDKKLEPVEKIYEIIGNAIKDKI